MPTSNSYNFMQKAVIIILVSDNERNSFDQRWVEFKIYEQNPTVRVLRRTYLDFHQHGRLDNENKLFIGEEEVAVVYMRDGYDPDQYASDKEWNGRLTIEMSAAIKCPCIQYQLMGSKKVQQELARPGVLEKFISSRHSIDMLRATFADLYSLDLGPEGDKAVEMAIVSPEKFVLKPQREGGGNNLYNTEIAKFLSEHKSSKERNAYILMERIFPWQQRNYLVKSGVPFVLSNVVSEIGVYGIYIGTAAEEIENFECGHMMRTKISDTDEGGVVAGFAVLDTPFLYE
ncbi:glutathione synthetase [Elysia marginata]|uniref:Glutathione synthetase n=1 Tax=Elysia marginata TaxID=1093978 RepID=A0AAV4I7E9_9GAST|nr:glutathione synthetase [Elysia marginata]